MPYPFEMTEEQRKKYAEDHEKAILLKEAVKIVDELCKFDYNDMAEDDQEKVEDLIRRAKNLSKHRLWKL